ncbi:MAG: hypothetical protein QNJ33_00165 [Crocosphaera sp.]|nr:hypothetical protein [Crocosphaera sp.]
MNTQLIETLAQIINALTLEEKALLQEKTSLKNSLEAYQKMVEVREKIFTRREGKPFAPPLNEYIAQTRDERTAQQDEFIRSCLGKKKVNE